MHQSLLKSTLEQMLVTVMLREVAQQVRSDNNHQSRLWQHSPKQHLYSVCVYTGREAGGFFYLSKEKQLSKGSHKHQSCCMGEG